MGKWPTNRGLTLLKVTADGAMPKLEPVCGRMADSVKVLDLPVCA